MALSRKQAVENPIVMASGVCVHHGDVVALAPTDLSIGSGCALALVGSNGSGKTTLLHLIAGLLQPTAGTIDIVGRVALVAQHQAHHPWMPLSVDEVLRMGRYRGLVHRLKRSDREAIDRAAERLEVAHLRRRAFGALSGGERQRVLVAKAVASGAEVLLLDEPITGLDLPSQARILEVIDEHARSGGTVVFSTHHLGEASRADRVLLMAGCVLADGRPEDVLYYFVLDGEPFIYKERVSPKGEVYEMYIDNKGKSYLDGEITEQLGLSVMGLRFSDVIDTIFNKEDSI